MADGSGPLISVTNHAPDLGFFLAPQYIINRTWDLGGNKGWRRDQGSRQV